MHFEPHYQIADSLYRLKNKLLSENYNFLDYRVPYKEPDSTYKNLICVTGFGHSGSGVILDYLSEFDNTTVVGLHDKDCSGLKNINDDENLEFDILRCPCGLFDIEEAVVRGNTNYFNDNFIVKNFIHLAQYLYLKGGIYTDKFWELTNAFIDEITDMKLPMQKAFEGLYYLGITELNRKTYRNLESPLLFNGSVLQYIYYLKRMSKEEFRKIANKYLTDFFKSINSKNFLVFDQIITDSKPNIEKKLEYLGDFKLVCVYRDPRDVYITGLSKHADWIPKNPENFVKWYKRRGIPDYIKEKHPKILTVRFEDCVLNYDSTFKIVNEFLGLNPKNHINKKEYFNPEVSKRNIGIYKNSTNPDDIKYIEGKLKEYCWK